MLEKTAPRIYNCSDLYLACFLRARYGLKIVNMGQQGKRKTFIFELKEKDPEIQVMIQDFYNEGSDSVSAGRFVREMQSLKSMLYAIDGVKK